MPEVWANGNSADRAEANRDAFFTWLSKTGMATRFPAPLTMCGKLEDYCKARHLIIIPLFLIEDEYAIRRLCINLDSSKLFRLLNRSQSDQMIAMLRCYAQYLNVKQKSPQKPPVMTVPKQPPMTTVPKQPPVTTIPKQTAKHEPATVERYRTYLRSKERNERQIQAAVLAVDYAEKYARSRHFDESRLFHTDNQKIAFQTINELLTDSAFIRNDKGTKGVLLESILLYHEMLMADSVKPKPAPAVKAPVPASKQVDTVIARDTLMHKQEAEKQALSNANHPSVAIQAKPSVQHTPPAPIQKNPEDDLSEEIKQLLVDSDLDELRATLATQRILTLAQLREINLWVFMNSHNLYSIGKRQDVYTRISSRLKPPMATSPEMLYTLKTPAAFYTGATPAEAFAAFCEYIARKYPLKMRSLIGSAYNEQGSVVLARADESVDKLKLTNLNACISNALTAQAALVYGKWICRMCGEADSPTEMIEPGKIGEASDTARMPPPNPPTPIEQPMPDIPKKAIPQNADSIVIAYTKRHQSIESKPPQPPAPIEQPRHAKPQALMPVEPSMPEEPQQTAPVELERPVFASAIRSDLLTPTDYSFCVPYYVVINSERLQLASNWKELCLWVLNDLAKTHTDVFGHAVKQAFGDHAPLDNSDLLDNGTRIYTKLSANALMSKLASVARMCRVREGTIMIAYEKRKSAEYPTPVRVPVPKPPPMLAQTPSQVRTPATAKYEHAFKDLSLSYRRPAMEAERLMRNAGLDGMTTDELSDKLDITMAQTKDIVNSALHIVDLPQKLVHIDAFADWEEGANKLEEIIDKLLAKNNGYISAAQLYEYARVEMHMFLNDNDLNDERHVFHVAQHLFEKVDHHGKHLVFWMKRHISRAGSDAIYNNLDLMRKFARDHGGVFTIEEMESYLESVRVQIASIRLQMRIDNEPIFLPYDEHAFITAESMHIDRDWLGTSAQALARLFEDVGDHIVMRDIPPHWFELLPSLPCGKAWTPLLLQSVIRHYGKELNARTICALANQDMYTLHAMLVRSDSEIQTFCDAVAAYFVDEGLDSRSYEAEELRQMLLARGMIAGNELIYNMPKVLRKDERFAWDAAGRYVTVRM